MKLPTEINEEVIKLKGLKERVIPTTLFGDSNTDAIQAQIDVLEQGWDEDLVRSKFLFEDETYVRNAALDAVSWRDAGVTQEGEEQLAEGWEGILR